MPVRKCSIAPINQTFGKLTVLRYSHAEFRSDRKIPRTIDFWFCRCECGTERAFEARSLLNGVKSCGCYHPAEHGESGGVRKNGTSPRSPEFGAYVCIKQRCYNPRTKNYKDYGGRGISLCAEWLHDYPAFLAHVGRRPSSDHSLERINNNGNYEPGNVKWATQKEQMHNTRRNRYITFQGQTHCISEWAEKLGFSRVTLGRRLKEWPLERAMTEKLN